MRNTENTRRRAAALAGAMLAFAATAAHAGLLDEVWAGGFAHDVNNLPSGKESGTADLQLELDSRRPRALRYLGAPRVNVTVSANTAGHTNFASAGLTWDHRLIGRLYGSADFGLAVTDGVIQAPTGPAGDYDRQRRLILGSRVLFREAGGFDWRFDRRWSLGIEFVHLSNGQILARGVNEGVNDVGLRLGYRLR